MLTTLKVTFQQQRGPLTFIYSEPTLSKIDKQLITMRVTTTLALVFALSRQVFANCKGLKAEDCYWDASCQTWNHGPGTVDPNNGYKVAAWTKDRTLDSLLSYPQQITQDCYEAHGSTCVYGWARLWCAPVKPK